MTHDNHHMTPESDPSTKTPTLEHLSETLAPLCKDNPVAMCITNRKSQIFHANQAFLDILSDKFSLEKIKGRALHRLFPSSSHRTIDRIETLINDKKNQTLQKLLRLDGKQKPIAMKIRIQMLHNPNDQHVEGALLTFFEDASWYQAHFDEEKQTLITRIRELSTDLMDRQSLLKAIMDRSPFGIAVMDNQRRVIKLNRTAENMLGMARSKARGILCNNLFHCFDQGQRCPILEDGQDVDKRETVCAKPGKTHLTFLHSAVRSRERNEDIIIEAFIDVTDMKEVEQAKAEAYQAKDDFFAKMSHELRTPLNAIIGYSELLSDESYPLAPGEQKEFASAIQHGGYDLLHLVDQVLEIAKLNENKADSEPLDLRPEVIMNEVAVTIRPIADKQHNQFSIHCDDDTGTVYADPEHLRAILLNLLSNACKFTENGEISLNIKRETGPNNDWVIFQVQDTGIGITDEQTERIFNRFEQADNSATRSYDGSGLGLSIVKSLCAIMDGEIEVQSQPDEGSIFTVKLPSKEPTK